MSRGEGVAEARLKQRVNADCECLVTEHETMMRI